MVTVLFYFGLCVYLVRHRHVVDEKTNLNLKLNDTYGYTYVRSDSEHQRRREIDVGAAYAKFQVEISVRETAYIHLLRIYIPPFFIHFSSHPPLMPPPTPNPSYLNSQL